MASYSAPLDEYRFLLNDVFGIGDLARFSRYEHATPDILEAVIEEAAKICEGVLHPLNAIGDQEGCSVRDGQVTTPPGFPAAYQAYAEGGWLGISGDPEHGAQGLPHSVASLVEEMVSSTNPAFGMYIGLAAGASKILGTFGSAEQQALYIEKLVSGEWLATMNLTEPHCGSDLALLRTKAEPAEDGSFKITGTKIFISGGDQDLTPNIVHLVLARLPDAPPGTRGISLFLVPKFLPDATGALGARNTAVCGGIEHKMGLKGSATCVMNFDAATGWLIGPPNGGLKAMFLLMNAARLNAAFQAVGSGESARQTAATYAEDRRQGRAPLAGRAAGGDADPIALHPDVKGMLLEQRALVEGGRALALMAAQALDIAEASEDAAERAAADDRVQLLTPVAKAFVTESCFNVTNLGIQILGGHGYVREWGIEQQLRDVRAPMIYEGTNGIQAQDLVTRKLALFDGRLPQAFFDEIGAFLRDTAAHEELGPLAARVLRALDDLIATTTAIRAASSKDPAAVAAVSLDYLRQFGFVVLGYLWIRMALAASQNDRDSTFAQEKSNTARFFVIRMLPRANGLRDSILAGLEEGWAF